MVKNLLYTLALLGSQASFAQDPCETILQLKTKTYGFKPADLSQKKKEEKNKQLNIFWDKIKKQGAVGTNCLRSLILAEQTDTYFCWDASALLFQLDTSDASLEVIKKGMEKCDLNDLQLEPFLQLTNDLGRKGINIENLTRKLLSLPNAKVFLTAHVITLDAMEAGIFLINTMSTERAEQFLIDLYSTGNSTAKKNAVLLLTVLSTDIGDRFIDTLRQKKVLDKEVEEFNTGIKKVPENKEPGTHDRENVLTALNDVPYNLDKNFFGFSGNTDLIYSAINTLDKKDIDKLRLARSKSTPVLSDEALSEYFTLTRILLYVRNK